MDTRTIASPYRDKAQTLLIHYLHNAAYGTSPHEDGEHTAEVREIVDHIVEAAKHELAADLAQLRQAITELAVPTAAELEAWRAAAPKIEAAGGCTKSCRRCKCERTGSE